MSRDIKNYCTTLTNKIVEKWSVPVTWGHLEIPNLWQKNIFKGLGSTRLAVVKPKFLIPGKLIKIKNETKYIYFTDPYRTNKKKITKS